VGKFWKELTLTVSGSVLYCGILCPEKGSFLSQKFTFVRLQFYVMPLNLPDTTLSFLSCSARVVASTTMAARERKHLILLS
jgi:hypothetical protein